jgi:UbiD family decarboxylase
MAEASFSDLRSFLDALRARGELRVVEAPVDPKLEVAEIHRRVIAAGGPALLFTSVLGADFPLVTNLFGTLDRARLAFGRRPHRLIRRAVEFAESALPPTVARLWGARDLVTAALRTGLRSVSVGPVTEVVSGRPELQRLPVITSWPQDGGPFITWPLVYTEHPRDGRHNLGVYRLQVHGPAETGMHWQIGKGGGFHHAAAAESGAELPVTVFLGGPPALTLAAVAPLPENVPELVLASLIAGQRLARCPGPGPHQLIAGAEFALVGKVPPDVRRPEGPFGDHYGYYSLEHDYPVFVVDHLCHRRDAIYPATVVGKPRQEDFFIGDLLQELLSPLFPLVMPGVRSIWSYGETGFHSLAAAVVRERYRREALASAFRILGEGQLSLTKFLLLTDRPVDLRDFRATLEHVLARTRTETDLYVLSNTSMDTLDYTGPEVNLGSKGVWLGLGEAIRDLPRALASAELPAGVTEAHVFCGGCLVVGGPSHGQDPGFAARLAADERLAEWPLVVLCDRPADTCSTATRFLWTAFTRFEPAADLYAAATRVVRHHLSYTAPIVLDARLKASYPAEVECDPDTAALVGRRWREYFPGGGVEMGDSNRAHLDG